MSYNIIYLFAFYVRYYSIFEYNIVDLISIQKNVKYYVILWEILLIFDVNRFDSFSEHH